MPHTDVGTSERLLEELSEWVKLETPTTDPTAVNRLMDLAEAELTHSGAVTTRKGTLHQDQRGRASGICDLRGR